MQHENKMQENAMVLQAKMEQDRVKFEAALSGKLQQQNSQFQMAMMQQSQLLQAELFKKLFDKKTVIKHDLRYSHFQYVCNN